MICLPTAGHVSTADRGELRFSSPPPPGAVTAKPAFVIVKLFEEWLLACLRRCTVRIVLHSVVPVVNSPIDSCDWSGLNHKIPLTGPKTNAWDLLAASFSSSFMQAGNLGLFHHHVCRLGTLVWQLVRVYQRGMSRRYRLFVFLKPAVFLRKKVKEKKKQKELIRMQCF